MSSKNYSYNRVPFDKNIEPTNINVTKQLRKEPNLIKMFFSSQDALVDTTITLDANNNNVVTILHNQPRFNIPTSIFHKFDPDRPVYVKLEFFYNTSATHPTDVYNLVWLNFPCSNSTWYTNNTYKNILGSFRTNGTNASYNAPLMPYILDPNQLLNTSIWQFNFVRMNHSLVDPTNCSSYLFCLCLYQDS